MRELAVDATKADCRPRRCSTWLLAFAHVRARAGARPDAVGLRLPLVRRALGGQPPGRGARAGVQPELADEVVLFQPQLQSTRAALPDVPLWDPYLLGGRPLMGDPQSAVFSLFSVPSYVLPFWKSLAVVATLKVFLAALGAFLLGRAVGMRIGRGADLRARRSGSACGRSPGCRGRTAASGRSCPGSACSASCACGGPGRCRSRWAWRLATGSAGSAATRRRASRCWWWSRCSSPVRALVSRGAAPAAGDPAAHARLGRWSRARALAAVVLIPFAELLAHSGDAGRPRGRVPALLPRGAAPSCSGFALHD